MIQVNRIRSIFQPCLFFSGQQCYLMYNRIDNHLSVRLFFLLNWLGDTPNTLLQYVVK